MRDRKNRFSQKAILTYDNDNSYLAAQNFEKKTEYTGRILTTGEILTMYAILFY